MIGVPLKAVLYGGVSTVLVCQDMSFDPFHVPLKTQTLAEEVSAWEAERNAAESSIDWRFTSTDARIKLKHLYPEIVEDPSYDPNLP